jgi:hypothetical protein
MLVVSMKGAVAVAISAVLFAVARKIGTGKRR